MCSALFEAKACSRILQRISVYVSSACDCVLTLDPRVFIEDGSVDRGGGIGSIAMASG